MTRIRIKNIFVYVYISISYLSIGIIGNWINPEYRYPLDTMNNVLLYSLISGFLIIGSTALINTLMKPDHMRFIGMMILISFYISIIIGSWTYFKDPGFLSFIWPAVLGATLLVLVNFHDGFQKWNKKDIFHAFLIVFMLASILYLFWGLFVGAWIFRQFQSHPLPKYEEKKVISNIILTVYLAPGALPSLRGNSIQQGLHVDTLSKFHCGRVKFFKSQVSQY
jgi:hypothetical protein